MKTKSIRKKVNYGGDAALKALCAAHGLPEPILEYPFNELDEKPVLSEKTGKPRKWRFDMLFGDWLAVEKVGGVWIHGHHSRGADQIDDMYKRNAAQQRGFVVLEFPTEDFDSGHAYKEIADTFGVGVPE